MKYTVQRELKRLDVVVLNNGYKLLCKEAK